MSEQVYRPLFPFENNKGYLSTVQKRIARACLMGRFGQKACPFCGRAFDPKMLHVIPYDIHHRLQYGMSGCNLFVNLVLAHHGCHSGKPVSSAAQMRDKDRIPPDATTSLRQIVDYSSGSKEMQANNEAEPTYRRLMWEKLEYGDTTMEKTRAIFGMAELIGVSPQATRDYYGKMTSEDGPFEEYKELGKKRVRVKK